MVLPSRRPCPVIQHHMDLTRDRISLEPDATQLRSVIEISIHSLRTPRDLGRSHVALVLIKVVQEEEEASWISIIRCLMDDEEAEVLKVVQEG